jgi:hypothetical protein
MLPVAGRDNGWAEAGIGERVSAGAIGAKLRRGA